MTIEELLTHAVTTRALRNDAGVVEDFPTLLGEFFGSSGKIPDPSWWLMTIHGPWQDDGSKRSSGMPGMEAVLLKEIIGKI